MLSLESCGAAGTDADRWREPGEGGGMGVSSSSGVSIQLCAFLSSSARRWASSRTDDWTLRWRWACGQTVSKSHDADIPDKL